MATRNLSDILELQQKTKEMVDSLSKEDKHGVVQLPDKPLNLRENQRHLIPSGCDSLSLHQLIYKVG